MESGGHDCHKLKAAIIGWIGQKEKVGDDGVGGEQAEAEKRFSHA